MVKWNIELVKEEMQALGLKGVSEVNLENFQTYAKKVRAAKRKLAGKEGIEERIEEKEIATFEKPKEEKPKHAIETKAEKRRERKQRKKEEMREVMLASVQKIQPGVLGSSPIALLPPDIPSEKARSMSIKELKTYFISPEVHQYIIDLGPIGIRRVILARIPVNGIYHRLNERMYAFSSELGKQILDRKLGVLVRELSEKRSEKEAESSDLEVIRKRESEKEDRKRERRAERKKNKKKIQVVSGGPRRAFKEKQE